MENCDPIFQGTKFCYKFYNKNCDTIFVMKIVVRFFAVKIAVQFIFDKNCNKIFVIKIAIQFFVIRIAIQFL